ncbi:LOW QUALITY PROTEIN: hypothetical protein Cgig2_001153 [Carnegiea gigantea]|uniref:Uncharacterized protein n=1 Tax=Carnegiea gigantea TaxID=171969 RepID=A0A9Q1QC98_9CARY|nr:LOW QUALITY PROTEIN: hypothetical protein Cgig2_001153 [Carnegiea gigantea]
MKAASAIVRRILINTGSSFPQLQGHPPYQRAGKVHLFGVPVFRLNPLALLHIVDVSLKVAVFLEPAPSALAAFSTPTFSTPTVASALAFASATSVVVLLLGLPSVFFIPQLLPTMLVPSCSLFQPSMLGHNLHCLSECLRTNSRRVNNIENGKLEKEEKKENVPPTSATVTSSSVTLGGSEFPEASKSHDLARSRTSSNLAAESAAQKLVEHTRVHVGVSPTDSEAACTALGVPRTPWGPRA